MNSTSSFFGTFEPFERVDFERGGILTGLVGAAQLAVLTSVEHFWFDTETSLNNVGVVKSQAMAAPWSGGGLVTVTTVFQKFEFPMQQWQE